MSAAAHHHFATSEGPAANTAQATPDLSTEEGAQKLKATIEAFWRDRGAHVSVLLFNAGFHPSIRAARFELRSDMINGMPRR